MYKKGPDVVDENLLTTVQITALSLLPLWRPRSRRACAAQKPAEKISEAYV